MQFHISNVLSEFDARFDDAMLRRSFIGRRQGDHGSRGRVSPHNSPGHPAYAPRGSSSRGKVSPENSPGHPANAPGGSTGSTGPGAGGPSVGDGGGGVVSGGSSSPSNDNSPEHPANAPGGSSSGGRVSPENSPGHPANAPTTGGTTGSDDDDTGGGNANFDSPNLQTGRNDVDSDGDGVTDHVVMVQEDGIERWYAADDRYREGYATGEYRFARTRDDGTRFEAQVDDEGRFRSERTYGASTYEDGTTITHRDTTGDGRADAMVANRPDGSVEIIRDTDGDGSPDQVMVEDASGLVHIYSAEEWAKERQRRGEYSGEETGKVTQANSEAAWDAHKPTIDRALAVLNDGGTPAELAAAAAEVARIAAAWRGSGVAADDGGLMADHLAEMSQTLSEAAGTTSNRKEQALAHAELQADIQQVADGEASLPAVLSKWEADPRSAGLMLQERGERLWAEEVGEYEGPRTEVSAVEWLRQAVAKDAAQRAAYQDTPGYREMLIAQEVGGFDPTLGMVPVGLDEMAAAQARNDYQAWLADTQRILPTEQELERGQRGRTEAFLGSVAMDLPSGVATSEMTAADFERLRAEAAGELPGDFAAWEAHQQEIIRQLDNAESSDDMVNWFATAYPGQTPPTVAEVEAARAKVLGETGDLYVDPQRRPVAPGGHSVGAWMPDQESEYNVEAQEYNRRLTNRSIALELGFLQAGKANAHPRRIRGPVEQFFQQGTAATGLPMDWVIPAAGFVDTVALSRYSGGPAGRLVTRGEARGVAIETALLGADLLPLPGPSGLVKAGGAVVRGVSRLQPIERLGSGFLMSATPYESVPRLITPQLSEAGLDASLALRRQLAETGHAEISIGGKVYTVSGDRFDQAMRLKNPNAPTLAYHADTDLTYQIAGGEVPHQVRPKLVDNQPVLDASGEPVFSLKGPSEQFEFLAAGGPVTRFSLSRAFGLKNAPPFWVRARQHPGITAYDIPFDELAVPGARSEPGGVNYFHGRELEVGVPTSDAELAYRQGTQMVLPATQAKVGIGPRLNEFLYLPETLEEPGYWMRTKANLLGLADRVDPSLQPGISVRSATREDVLLDAVGEGGSWVDVRASRARTGDFWVDEAVDPSAREARAQVVLLDNGALRRLVDDPATPANIRQAADDLLDVRRTTTIDRPTIRTESRSMGRDVSVPHARFSESIRQTIDQPRTEQSDSWADLRTSDLRTPDLRTPDPRTPDPRTPDPRTPDLRTPDLRTPDPRTPDPRTPDPRTPDLRTPDLRTPDPRTPDLRTPDLRTPDLRTPDLRTPDPRTPDLRTPDLRTPDLRTPDLRTPDLRTPDLRTPDLRTPDLRTPDLRTPDLRTPDLRTPDLRTPDLRTPDLRTPGIGTPDLRTPGIGTPDLTRERRVRLPEVDEAPMTVVKAEEGLYPRVVAHDELIRVYHDLDTGEVRTEPLAMPTEPIVIKHDDTPPPIESRFSGHRQITPRGGYVFTKPVGERRRKASSKRHPYLRKGELRRR